MKNSKRIQLAILCSLLSIGIFIYLSVNYYHVKFGSSHYKALCHINDIFNCSAVSLSPYSFLFGIPTSIWGLSFHVTLFSMLIMYYFCLVDSVKRLGRFCFYLASLSLMASLVMGAISLFFMNVYCLFCWVLYLLSFLQWELLRRIPGFFAKEEGGSRVKEIFHFILSKKGMVSLVFIPFFAFFIHSAWMRFFGFSRSENWVRDYVREWKVDSFFPLDVPPSLQKGPSREKAELVVSEYADFLCIHCKNAFLRLSSFSKAYPKVRFEFYNFPLDGSCNEGVGFKSGVSCRLAKSVHCLTTWNQGWTLHDEVFLKQGRLKKKSLDQVNVFLKEFSQKINVSWGKWLKCIESEETQETLKKQFEQAKNIGISGTPSFYVNGKKVSSSALVPVLEMIRKESLKEKNHKK